mgnify:CR=1 FL=1
MLVVLAALAFHVRQQALGARHIRRCIDTDALIGGLDNAYAVAVLQHAQLLELFNLFQRCLRQLGKMQEKLPPVGVQTHVDLASGRDSGGRPSRGEELAHYRSKVELDTMCSIKRALDPQNIMNPGKILNLSS